MKNKETESGREHESTRATGESRVRAAESESEFQSFETASVPRDSTS